MNIHHISSTPSASTLKISSPAAYANTKAASYQTYNGAEADLSTAAQLLGRNQAELRAALAPRPEVLQQYSAAINEPVKLHDRSIDRILHNLQRV